MITNKTKLIIRYLKIIFYISALIPWCALMIGAHMAGGVWRKSRLAWNGFEDESSSLTWVSSNSVIEELSSSVASLIGVIALTRDGAARRCENFKMRAPNPEDIGSGEVEKLVDLEFHRTKLENIEKGSGIFFSEIKIIFMIIIL